MAFQSNAHRVFVGVLLGFGACATICLVAASCFFQEDDVRRMLQASCETPRLLSKLIVPHLAYLLAAYSGVAGGRHDAVHDRLLAAGGGVG